MLWNPPLGEPPAEWLVLGSRPALGRGSSASDFADCPKPAAKRARRESRALQTLLGALGHDPGRLLHLLKHGGHPDRTPMHGVNREALKGVDRSKAQHPPPH